MPGPASVLVCLGQVGPESRATETHSTETHSICSTSPGWVSSYQSLYMMPPYGQDGVSVVPFSRRLTCPSLPPCCKNKQNGPEAPFNGG